MTTYECLLGRLDVVLKYITASDRLGEVGSRLAYFLADVLCGMANRLGAGAAGHAAGGAANDQLVAQ